MSGEGKTNTNMNDPQSAYYLCSADHLRNIILPIIFNGENYASWSRIVTNAFKSKNKFGGRRIVNKAREQQPRSSCLGKMQFNGYRVVVQRDI